MVSGWVNRSSSPTALSHHSRRRLSSATRSLLALPMIPLLTLYLLCEGTKNATGVSARKTDVPSLSTSVVSGSGLPTQLPCQRILEASPLHKCTCGGFSVSISSQPCCSHTSYVRNQRKIAPVRGGNIWRQNVCGDTACPHWHAPSSTDTRGCVRYKQTTGIRGPHL